MVEENIYYFENLSMDHKKSHEKTSSKLKRYIAEITEIKRPAGKTRTLAESSEVCAKSATLPRQSVKSFGESSRLSKHASMRTEKEEFLHQKAKTKVKGILKKSSNTDHIITTRKECKERRNSDENNKKTKARCVTEDCNLLDSLSDSSDDMFGFNDFDDDCSDNYIIEAYNKPGQELIITTLEITRKTISRDDNEETLKNLISNSDYVFHKEEYESTSEKSSDSLSMVNDSYFKNNYLLATASNESVTAIFDEEIYEEVNDYVDMTQNKEVDDYVHMSQNNIGDPNFETTEIVEDNYFHNVEISSDNEELDIEIKNLPSPTRNVEIEKK